MAQYLQAWKLKVHKVIHLNNSLKQKMRILDFYQKIGTFSDDALFCFITKYKFKHQYPKTLLPE
jgi:hypothetical protein